MGQFWFRPKCSFGFRKFGQSHLHANKDFGTKSSSFLLRFGTFVFFFGAKYLIGRRCHTHLTHRGVNATNVFSPQRISSLSWAVQNGYLNKRPSFSAEIFLWLKCLKLTFGFSSRSRRLRFSTCKSLFWISYWHRYQSWIVCRRITLRRSLKYCYFITDLLSLTTQVYI